MKKFIEAPALGSIRTDLENLLCEQRWDDARRALQALEAERGLDLDEQVIKSRSILMSNEDPGLPLSEVERILREVLAKDSSYIPAILDLGWYYYAVSDETERAVPQFNRVIDQSVSFLLEGLRGLRGSLRELGREGDLASLEERILKRIREGWLRIQEEE